MATHSTHANKETISAVAPAEENKTVTVTHVAGSKAAKAQTIFNEDGRNKPRKDVIARMVKETGLTQSGASTYYQNMKQKAGMVTKRVLVTSEITQGGHVPSVQGAQTAPSASKE